MKIIIPFQLSTLSLFFQEIDKIIDAFGAFLGLDWKIESRHGEVVALGVIFPPPCLKYRDEFSGIITKTIDLFEDDWCDIGIWYIIGHFCEFLFI